MLVGRNVVLRRPTGQHDGTLILFRHNNELRIIRNEPNFTAAINSPLPLANRPVHPFSQHPFIHHAKPNDPPVRHRIRWQPGVGWATVGIDDAPVHASASYLLKDLMLVHRVLAVGGFADSPAVVVDRRVWGGHLDIIITQSPHTPLNGCSHVLTWEAARISFEIPPGDNQDVRVTIRTTEAAAVGVPHDAPSPNDSP
ncbi:unnamed protein product [Vitrella brassicaformis CCMP3155]|uniref:Uncharacterized protein n=1 Tax=Vitrella brassicaformis (strain CCMP3155) TaxID=1169540 RepID=A0A0G4F9Y4_VITBC|nr:unnamed protein product [Vitrella brassicaformis CCMP3155]|eukprot:CEM09695.1 unnamed protein product [Vitrella brassicaformis CCMP3155]